MKPHKFNHYNEYNLVCNILTILAAFPFVAGCILLLVAGSLSFSPGTITSKLLIMGYFIGSGFACWVVFAFIYVVALASRTLIHIAYNTQGIEPLPSPARKDPSTIAQEAAYDSLDATIRKATECHRVSISNPEHAQKLLECVHKELKHLLAKTRKFDQALYENVKGRIEATPVFATLNIRLRP